MVTPNVPISGVEHWLDSWYRRTYAGKVTNQPFSSETAAPYFVGAGTSYYLVFDYHRNSPLYVSRNLEKMTGYNTSEWMNHDLASFARYIHPEDRQRLFELTSQVDYYCRTLPSEKRLYTWENYTFRFRRANGSYFHILRQEIALQLDTQGNPSVSLWFGSDISHLKSDNRVVATVTDVDEQGNQSIRDLTNAQMPDNNTSPRLSLREQEIIRLLAQGLSSKQIANTLHLSFHTVTTHKRNIFEKTASHNAHALVGFAMRNGII